MPTPTEFERRIAAIEDQVRALEGVADPSTRAAAQELVRSLMDLYAAGLERLLGTIRRHGEAGTAIVEQLGRDELVSNLLLLHDLHPVDRETRVHCALEKTRPYLRSHGGNVELVGLDADGVVTLRLQGSCHGCPSSAMTLKLAIEQAIHEAAPDVTAIVVEGGTGNDAPAPPLVSLEPAASGAWRDLPEFPSLRRFTSPHAPVERCDLCGLELTPEHDHVIEPETRRLACACTPCALLCSRQAGTRYRRVPRDVVRLDDFAVSDAQWEGLRLPIDLAFFYYSSPQARMVACYPSPAGATESLLELETWEEIRRENPVLAELQPDVQALLVNRVRRGPAAPACFLVPIDQCFRLVGLIRLHWKGFSGGNTVWAEIDGFFTALARSARTVRPAGEELHA